MISNFYEKIEAFSLFSDACKPENYHAAPDGWLVVVTDVIDSTKAIHLGRYKDVNMAGAACIASVTNCCKGYTIPFIFGGDGATFLIPSHLAPFVKEQLQAVKQSVVKNHQLNLRVGLVPIEEIKQRGKEFKVAKYKINEECSLAMFGGGGAILADNLVKSGSFNLPDNEQELSPDLTGLSCRWQPITPRYDSMLTLLVSVNGEDSENETYSKVNNYIARILDEKGCPVNTPEMSYKWPSIETMRQSKMVWNQGNIFKNIIHHVFFITLFNIFIRFGLRIGPLDLKFYKQDMILNSDYRKFDDMLRMVVDCTTEQSNKIQSYLYSLHQEGRIFYGIHHSNTALMTCFLTSFSRDGHVHFIDGNDGGYAIAAQKLKKQIENSKAPPYKNK